MNESEQKQFDEIWPHTRECEKACRDIRGLGHYVPENCIEPDRLEMCQLISSLIATKESIWREETENKLKCLPQKYSSIDGHDVWRQEDVLEIIQDKKQK